MATKYLDLDALTPDDITIQLNGVAHTYREMSVGDFIWAQKEAKKSAAEVDEEGQLASMIGIIRRSFPTIPQEQLETISLKQLRALVDFILQIGSPLEGSSAGEPGKEPSPEVTNQ